MNNSLICNQCGFAMIYDIENTWYLKCPCCDKILVDVDLSEKSIEELIVVDNGRIYDYKWVTVRDKTGNLCTYWKR